MAFRVCSPLSLWPYVAFTIMSLKKLLKEYYKQCELTLKPNPQWRLYKIQLITGAWLTIPNQIRNEWMLRKELIKHTPINVFSTVCSFMNPLALENPHFTYAGHIYLSDDSFIFIDIDEHNPKKAENIKEFMISEGRYELWKETDSGNGIHQYYWDNEAIRYKDPIRKLDYQMRLREKLVARFKAAEIEFDYKCLTDLTRVSRVLGTPNDGDLTKICKEIHTYKDLQRQKAPMKGERSSTLPPNSRHNIRGNEACRSPSFPKPLAMKFVDSVVQGVKDRWVPYLKLHKSKHTLKRLKYAIEFYRLGETYIWETERDIIALSLKAVDRNRYRKILSSVRAKNLRTFLNFGHTWFRTSNYICENNVNVPAPVYKMKMGSIDVPGQYSRPHYNLLKSMKIPLPKNLELVGDEQCPIKVAFDKKIVQPGESS